MASVRAADRARIENIEANIVLLKRSIRGLRARKKKTQKQLNSYTYPVLTLPAEIVSEIFLHCIPVYPRCPSRTGRGSPLLLAQICSEWREVALATPALWRAISLDGCSESENYTNFLESWLSRSGGLLLSIKMDDIYNCALTSADVEAILPHRARWEHVSLSITPDDFLTIDGLMPQLRHFEIQVQNNDFRTAAFRNVPRLYAATLWDFTYPTELLPWAQLTSLTLVAKTPRDIRPILKQTPHLVHCQLAVQFDFDEDPPITNLLHLESLILMQHWVGDDPPVGYLDGFALPALRRLQIPDNFLRPDPVKVLASFISRSGCTLHEVLITGEITIPMRSYRLSFPNIPKFLFDRVLVDYMAWEVTVAEPDYHSSKNWSDVDSESE
ncbi:hypothetical protein DFH07DRAFT_926202 [Mycena maculata]|uniref:F-box domain-containing protein n=1 Tax=Mycena maculata TaxID=230809 RepID=A0AAD7IGF2_9AGAR|nr:hypothetical protein DFH07DRAFT_926202 [Mycena maculata]